MTPSRCGQAADIIAGFWGEWSCLSCLLVNQQGMLSQWSIYLSHLSFADSLDYPVLLAQRAAIVLFHPQGHAAVVEGMVTLSPDHDTVLLLVFSLTSKTGIHHLDPADGTGIALNVPAPHGYRVPLLEREHLVASRLGACAPGVRRKDAGFLAVLHVGHGGGPIKMFLTVVRGSMKSDFLGLTCS